MFCKSLLSKSVMQSQLFTNWFVIKKVFMWPESWKPQTLFQEEVLPTYCILGCVSTAREWSALWSFPLNIWSYVVLTAYDQGVCVNAAGLGNGSLFLINPQKNGSLEMITDLTPWVIHKWIRRWVGLCSTVANVKVSFSGIKMLADLSI